MYGKHNQIRDSAMTLALALDLLAHSNKKMSEEMELLPTSFTTKGKIECSKQEARKIIRILMKENQKKDTTDGIKIIFDKLNWVMIRPSGTEQIVRIYAESDCLENLHDLFAKYMSNIKSILAI